MTDEVFAKVLRDCRDLGVKDVNMQYLGEPLLDRKIFARIWAAKAYGFRVQMVSNASLLNEARARELLSSGIDELRVSIDGFTKKTFEDIRIGLKFEQVKQNIARFLELRSQLQGAKPRVVMHYVGLQENVAESKAFYEFWHQKVDLVLISQAKDWAGQIQLVQLGATYSADLPRVPCNHLWEEIFILRDGKVSVCCESYDGQILVGDITKQSLGEIWFGPEYQRLRKLHHDGRAGEISHCSTCKYYAIW